MILVAGPDKFHLAKWLYHHPGGPIQLSHEVESIEDSNFYVLYHLIISTTVSDETIPQLSSDERDRLTQARR